MQTVIDKILPIVALILGWGLSEFGKYTVQRKNDKKTLKRLLFNLLELRWLIKLNLELNEDISTIMERIRIKLSDLFGSALNESESQATATMITNLLKPILNESFKEKMIDIDRIKEIETNIDATLTQLAEVEPVLAYELCGRFKYKDKLDNVNNYLDKISQLNENVPDGLITIIEPKLTQDVLKDLDKCILNIAQRISTGTRKNVIGKLTMNTKIKISEIDKLFDDSLKETMALISKNEILKST
jgi:hypothetical protein